MMGFISVSFSILIQVSILYQVSFWISKSERTIEKQSAYECGQEPVGDARMKFDILYYVIGILYLIFDQEIIFQFPQASILYSQNSLIAQWSAMIFQIILTVGFIYEYKAGSLSQLTFLLTISYKNLKQLSLKSCYNKIIKWFQINRLYVTNGVYGLPLGSSTSFSRSSIYMDVCYNRSTRQNYILFDYLVGYSGLDLGFSSFQ